MHVGDRANAEKVIAASGMLLLVASFLTWFELETGVGDFARDGWDVGFVFGPLPVLLGVVMVAHVATSSLAPDLAVPDLPWPKVHLGAGIAAAVLVVVKLVIGADIAGVELDRGIGIYVAALAAVGLAVGGVLHHQEHDGAATTR